MYIFESEKDNEEVHSALRLLIPQLSKNNLPPTAEELIAFHECSASTLIAARWPDIDGPIVGVLTLIYYWVPTGMRAYIEDVVVHESHRGRGIGAALIEEGLRRAKQAGAGQVSLTSHPSRKAANYLYKRMGFQIRETNVYVYQFSQI